MNLENKSACGIEAEYLEQGEERLEKPGYRMLVFSIKRNDAFRGVFTHGFPNVILVCFAIFCLNIFEYFLFIFVMFNY